jgi:hypothetical protein
MSPDEIVHHAKQMAELFPPDKMVNECECCRRHSVELRAVFEWRGTFHTAETALTSTIGMVMTMALFLHVFHFLMPSKQVDFSTMHGFCEDCFAQIKKRNRVAGFVKQLCLALIVLAAMIVATVIVFVVVFAFSEPTKANVTYAAIGLAGSLVCLAAGLTAQDRIVRWCLPKTIRFISKPPFELFRFQRISI